MKGRFRSLYFFTIVALTMLLFGFFSFNNPSTNEENASGGDTEEPAHASDNNNNICKPNGNLPSIHFPLPTTSKNLKDIKSITDLPLLRYALTTIIATVEPDSFRYDVEIGADSGDIWYDNMTTIEAIKQLFLSQWELKWPNHCPPFFAFHIYNNTHSRNTWVSNYLAHLGFERGCDYFFRINDDTRLKPNNWSSAYVAALARNEPIPGLGVVGPADPFLKNEWLTHSFVGRLHFYIFGTYFPFLFGNWWSDNWVQLVYAPPFHPTCRGKNMTLMKILLDIPVEHMIVKSRYTIKATEKLFHQQLAIDKEVVCIFIEEYLRSHNRT
jgi:hypothetical protein